MEAKIFNFTGYGAQNPNHKRKINELTRALTQQGHHDTVDHLSKVNDGELLIVAGSYSTRLATMLKMHVTNEDPSKKKAPIFLADPGYISNDDLVDIASTTGRDVIHSNGFDDYKIETNDDNVKCSFDASTSMTYCFTKTKLDGTQERQKAFEIANNNPTKRLQKMVKPQGERNAQDGTQAPDGAKASNQARVEEQEQPKKIGCFSFLRCGR